MDKISEKIVELIKEEFAVKDITMDTHLIYDLSADSLNCAMLMILFKEQFGIGLDYDDFVDVDLTVGSIIENIKILNGDLI